MESSSKNSHPQHEPAGNGPVADKFGTPAGATTSNNMLPLAPLERIDRFQDSIIDGKYQVISLLGKGGMSSVYKAKNTLTQRMVAVKIMHRHLISDDNAVRRFQHEATAASRLTHPNSITVWDMGFIDQTHPYLIMDYLEGRSLAEEIKSKGALGVQRSLHIFIQSCAALSHAHQKGIVHRDLKPSNVMLIKREDDDDFVKVVDFGIAKIIDGDVESLKLTATGEVFGSPLYMSPEQCQGKKLDARSDIYSMGCLMYEALTGRAPFEGNNALETMYKHMNEAPAGFGHIDADARLVQRIEDIVLKCLAKDPSERPQTMLELKDDLEKAEKFRGRGLKAIAQMSMQLAKQQRRLFNYWFGSASRSSKVVLVSVVSVLLAVALCGGVLTWLLSQMSIPPLASRLVPARIPQPLDVSGKLEKGHLAYKMASLLVNSDLAPKTEECTQAFYCATKYAALLKSAGRYGDALFYYDKAIGFLHQAGIDETKLRTDMGEVYAGMAECALKCRDPGQLPKARMLSKRAMSLFMESTDSNAKLGQWGLLGQVLDLLHDQSAPLVFAKILAVYQPLQFSEFSPDASEGVASALQAGGDYHWKRVFDSNSPADRQHEAQSAIQFYASAGLEWKKQHNSYNAAAINNQLGTLFMLLGDCAEDSNSRALDYQRAEDHLAQAAPVLKTSKYAAFPLFTEADVRFRMHDFLSWLMKENQALRQSVDTSGTSGGSREQPTTPNENQKD